MGRKIPGRKHKGVKDVEKQHAERFAKIKDKINAPPENPDDQQFSKSLLRIMDLKNKVKEGAFKKKRKGVLSENVSNTKFKRKEYQKPVPKFKQRQGESDRDFKRRVNLICNEVVKEAAFEDKYKVNIKRNQNGEVESVEKRIPDELELYRKKLLKEKRNKKLKKKKPEEQEKLTKSQKWALKKAKKKEERLLEFEKDERLKPKTDVVKFGEVVHAPPTLSQPRRVNKLEGAPRPGQKSLLLKSMFPESNVSKETVSKVGKTKGHAKVIKTIDKKGKRKNLPNALRRQLETQQKEIIEAYKKLKNRTN